MMMTKKIVGGVAIAVLAAGLAGGAVAADKDTRWERNHPRREEVNDRLANQNRRIHQEVREGEMSHQQAARLHNEDHQIRQEERLMAGQNGGHITRQEQQALNQQENAVSRQIGH